jgi:nickel-dependent lactate racemase
MDTSGSLPGLLGEEDIRRTVGRSLADWRLEGRRVLLVVPDQTRSCPLGLLFRLIHEAVGDTVRQLDVMIALGTHPPMSEEQIRQRLEITEEERRTRYGRVRFFNHAWDDPRALMEVGRLAEGEIRELTGGLFAQEIPVTCNRRVRDYDVVVIVGPVFPHEVIGFSGGNKYIFPGISGPEILHFFHWLGAVITNPRIIGNKWTPVRRVVDRAAALLPVERRAFCMVVEGAGLAGLFAGTPEEAWSAAADLSARVHVIRTERAYHTVLSCAPAMYDELWVGGKCMYKLEPALADGAELIIHAPHIRQVSQVHGELIRRIGYHTRDYFLKQWDRFKDVPWGILAHSTHVKGIGTYINGIERPRVNVVLATGIAPDECRAINLGYRDPATIRVEDFAGREAEGILHVPKAGEMLYRWKDAPPELGGEGA